MDSLSHIPSAQLLTAVRDWMFRTSRHNRSVAYVTKVLECAAVDNAECAWLLDKLRCIPEFGANWKAKCKWIAKTMKLDESPPRADYYRGRALQCFSDAGSEFVQRSAEAGFAPAMAELGYIMIVGGSDADDAKVWIRKAVALNDPDGMYEIAVLEKLFEMHRAAADRGSIASMYELAQRFSEQLTSITAAAAFFGRAYLFDPQLRCPDWLQSFSRKLLKGTIGKKEMRALYAAGREISCYEQLWDKGNHPPDEKITCFIDVYRTVTQRARQAALCTVMALTSVVVRDVAKLIGKTIYAAREHNAGAWYGTMAAATGKKQKH
jgi:TPR repeat protein